MKINQDAYRFFVGNGCLLEGEYLSLFVFKKSTGCADGALEEDEGRLMKAAGR